MTSPLGDANANVRLSATATFAQVIAEAKRAERAIDDLRRSEDRLNRDSVRGAREVASAAKERASAISSQSSALRAAASENERYARSFDTISKNLRSLKKDYADIDRTSRTFAANTDKLASAFERLGRAQSGRSGFGQTTKREFDQASAALEQFENRLQTLFATSANQSIDLNVNTESALNEVAKLAAEIQLLTRGVNEVEIRVNTNSTLLQAQGLSRAIRKEFSNLIDPDAFAETQNRFRQISQDIAAEAAEFRREQSRLDRELLDEQLELENRFSASRGTTDRDTTSTRPGFLDDIRDFFEENRQSLRQVADSFENSISNLSSKLEDLNNSSNGGNALAEVLQDIAQNAGNSTEEIDELNSRIAELEKREASLDERRAKAEARRLSAEDKINQKIKESDLRAMTNDALREKARDLNITGPLSRMRKDELVESIRNKLSESSIAEQAEQENKRQAAQEVNAAREELLRVRAEIQRARDIRASRISRTTDLRRAGIDRDKEELRQANRLELEAIKEASRLRAEESRRQRDEQIRSIRERERLEAELNRRLKEFERSRIQESSDLVKREYAERRAALRDLLSPKADRDAVYSVYDKDPEERSKREQEITDAYASLARAKQSLDESIAASREARDLLRRELATGSDIETRLASGADVDELEISEHREQLAIVRQEAKEADDLVERSRRLREDAESRLVTAVQRAEQEKTAARRRALAEEERDNKKRIRDQERYNKLSTSERLGVFSRRVATDVATTFNTSRLDDNGRILSLRRAYAELRREIAKPLAGANFSDNLRRGFQSLGDASSDFLKKFLKMRGEIFRMPGIIVLLISSISGLIAGLGAAGAGFLGLANAAASALGVLGAVPGILAAIGAAGAAIALGTSGIGDALSANQALRDARQVKKDEDAAKTGTDKDDSVTRARQLRAATRGYEDALDSLSDAQRDQKRAQADIAKAWREAKEDLIDLQFTVRQGVIDEERAIINLRKARLELAKIQAGGTEDPVKAREALLKLQEARREYNKVLADGNSNAIERARALRKVNEAEIAYAEATRKRATRSDKEEAQLDVRDAELALEKIRERNKRDQRELKKIQDEGLGSTDKVISANERLASANDRVADAQEAVAEAALRLKEVQEDSEKGSDKAKKGVDSVQKALDKLEAILGRMSPSQRKFTEKILELIPAFEDLKRTLAEDIFKPVVDDLELLPEVLGLAEDSLRPTAKALGELFEQGLKLVTSGPFSAKFKEVGGANYTIIKNLGQAFFDIAESFLNITLAAGDFTEWLTKAFSGAAKNFKIWSETSRANGTIAEFLKNSKEDLKQLAEIFGNLGEAAISYYKATEDQGDYVLERIRLMTKRWAEVAKEQENAGSGLQEFLVNSRPALSALASLLGAIGAAFAEIASDPENLELAVSIFETLEHDVLPPLVRALNAFADLEISPVIAEALGDILDALASFLEGPGGAGIEAYFNLIALFIKGITAFVQLPGISQAFGAVAFGLAAIAAAGTIAKFSGILKLFEFFQWLAKNREDVRKGLKGAADGIDDVNKKANGGSDTPNFPSSDGSRKRQVIVDTDIDNIDKDAKKVKDAVDDVDKSAGKLKGAAGKAKSAMAGLGSAVGTLVESVGGGGAGLAIAGALITVGFYTQKLEEQKQKIEELRDGLLEAASAYKETGDASSDAVQDLVNGNAQLREMVELLGKIPGAPSLSTALSGLSGNEVDYRTTMDFLNAQVNKPVTEPQDVIDSILNYATYGQYSSEDESNRSAYKQAYEEAKKREELDKQLIESAQKVKEARRNSLLDDDFKRNSGLAVEDMNNLADSTLAYRDALAVINDPLATLADKLKAVQEATRALFGEQANLIEQEDNWEAGLDNLDAALEKNGKSLDNKTEAGRNNRKALKELATQAREYYEQDIANGVPQEEATERFKRRIGILQTQAEKFGDNKQVAQELITVFGQIPSEVMTSISLLEYGPVKEALIEMLGLQLKGKNPNLSTAAAITEVRRDAAQAARANDPNSPFKARKAYGGFVSGPGGPRDDMIPAWLSNKEFVQPADSTEHYGVPFMEKLRRKQIPKQAVQKIEGMGFSTGGHVNCEHCASGQAHVQKFANGGVVKWPFKIDVSKTKTDFDYFGEDPSSSGPVGAPGEQRAGTGWRWLVQVMKKFNPNIRIISTTRPGDRTLGGNVSLHALGKAVDTNPDRATAEFLYKNYGKYLMELITPWRDLMLYRGKPAKFNRAIEAQHGVFGNNAHIHAGTYREGGLVSPFDFSALSQSKPTDIVPPRTLSQAAQSVVNNAQNTKETNYNITVNNPMQERGGGSIRASLFRATYLN